MTGSVNVKKIYSTVENVDGCKSAIKAIIPVKERMAAPLYEINNTTAEIFPQIMNNFKIFHEIITASFEEWMAATLYVTRIVILLKKRE